MNNGREIPSKEGGRVGGREGEREGEKGEKRIYDY